MATIREFGIELEYPNDSGFWKWGIEENQWIELEMIHEES